MNAGKRFKRRTFDVEDKAYDLYDRYIEQTGYIYQIPGDNMTERLGENVVEFSNIRGVVAHINVSTHRVNGIQVLDRRD